MKTQTSYQPIPPTPKEYWEDERWADEHINEIVKGSLTILVTA